LVGARAGDPGKSASVGRKDQSRYYLGLADWAQLTEAVNRVDIGLAVVEDGIVRLANHAAETIAGRKRGDGVGVSLDDIVRPTDVVLRDVDEMAAGNWEGMRARRVLVTPVGKEVPIWVTIRVVEVGGRRLGVSLFMPEEELGHLGRHPTRGWMDLMPVCVGFADTTWRIHAISAEVYDLLGRFPGDCVGVCLLDWVAGDDAQELGDVAISDPVAPNSFPRVAMRAADGSTIELCLLLAQGPPRDHKPGPIDFALVGRVEDYFPVPADRIAELEMHLRRIGAEVRAAGVLNSFSSLPEPAIPELTDLTTRQWEILTRIAQGQRVSTIAKALDISPSTVRNHLAVIFQKFGVRNQAELIEHLRTAPEGP